MTQFMLAIELLDELDAAPPYNLKVIIDTEEELGSPNLAPAIREHRELTRRRPITSRSSSTLKKSSVRRTWRRQSGSIGSCWLPICC
jgi:hypothetical protein